MNKMSWLKMVVLAAIWGSSFIFMKILVPTLGVLPTACLRILISGTVLISAMKILGVHLKAKTHFRHYLIVGFLNAALPFFLYSFAALHAPASLSVIMNATTPLFGAVFSLLWLSERMTWMKGLGFFLGTFGVSLIALKGSHGSAQQHSMGFDFYTILAAAAGLAAAACYALTGVYMKKFAHGISPYSMAGMSHFLGGLILLPFALAEASAHPISMSAIDSRILGALLGLSLLCSSVGFMIFYHLVERVGPSQSLTVGYIIPAFGMLWGALFLGERIQPEMILGTLLILSAVSLISKKRTTSEPSLNKALVNSIIEKEAVATVKASLNSSEKQEIRYSEIS